MTDDGQELPWQFVIADTNKSIIGLDFLRYYKFSIDVFTNKITSEQHTISCVNKLYATNLHHLSFIKNQVDNDPFNKLLLEFEDLTRPNHFDKAKAQHNTVHHIKTKGPPVYSRARRLHPQKLEIARENFKILQEQGIISPACSPWASPLLLVPKKNDKFR